MADADGGHYRVAFAACKPTLEALARASDESGRMAARSWWVVCMGSQLQSCKGAYSGWREEAAAELPQQLTASDTTRAIGLPGFEPMARCVLACGEAVGVKPDRTLDHVEAAGVKQQASAEWQRATSEVEPLRQSLQSTFLQKESRGFFSRGSSKPALAAKPADMGIDELRVCQVYYYGLASRLSACQHLAAQFSTAAGMQDANAPLLGYDEEKWDPTAEPWKRMELCVHTVADQAGTEADRAWRRGRPLE